MDPMDAFAQSLRDDADDEEVEAIAALTAIGPKSEEAITIARVEVARRAEIRIMRQEYGGKHDASWYNSRQTEAQWLSEMGVEE